MDEQRASRPTGNLPSLASSFVGRQRELAEVKRRMEASRLLTLTGPGGVGKTRLSVQAGILARRAFPDGVWLVDLAALEDPARLADAVAAALGVKEQSTRLAKEQLAGHLADRHLLMILDNCEHLVVACAGLVDCLLRRAPGLRVLATSRQPLGIPGEQILVVDPLPVPAPGTLPPTDLLARYEAVALLVDRASAVRPEFELTEANSGAVARLCARLDGLPLAIELAATRLRSLSVEQVADRLDDRFHLLARGNPAALSRQQTLRALMDWSYDLCTEPERTLWARLSVFPGEFDLAAVEGICSGSGIDAPAVLDLLDDLVAKSVVAARPDSPRARYRLLETIRQYGRELLARDGQEPALRRRHRDYYLRLAQHSCDTWCGPGQAETLTLLRVERDNLLAALDWSLAEPGEPTAALALMSALRYHWTLGGFLATGRRLFDQVLAASREPAPVRGHALWVAAWIALLQGDRDAAVKWLDECSQIAERHDDDHLRAYVLILSGTAALFAGDPGEAARHFEPGLDLMRQQGDTPALLWGLFQYSVAVSHCEDSARAQAACAEAIRLAEERGETWARSEAMWACGFDQWVAGDKGGAAPDLVREALTLTPNANYVSTVLGIELLAWIAGSRSNHDTAARLLGAASGVWQSLGSTIDAFGPIFSRYSSRAREEAIAHLGDARFRSMFEEGKRDPRDALGLRTEVAVAAGGAGTDTPKLTRRERQVARLITKGLTNKAIATELVLSPRTVEGHVERVFDKIGVTTRAQVAVWMAQHDPES
ncbi:LuxR family transcriptional regulator [Amycolatopsis deserti]|uniref:LuxR family transcriptional regulator n=1 Tax=Amycolatopsis deserti TaxID=185696 RepID=A0ABQ3IDK2_9PSEU|nr:LuxR C-terminal-related transcriptional regulator [Amycolatopsis deserti]GHE80378.1 LuxR family transcriptional regulator [Amycolatopsis deserti]